MLDLKLVEHCAPTLAGMKTANLFNYRFTSIDALQEEIQAENQKISGKGVWIEVLKVNEEQALLYVYRRKRLEADLQKEGVKELLEKYGYTEGTAEGCLRHLKERLSQYECFPHEIGVFLSYPLGDVIGFIEQKGKNCKCCGVWKAYCNEQETMALFEKFRKCTDVYRKVFAEGRSLMRLTVAA